jgi:hypothetical protein
VRKEQIHDQLQDFALIYSGLLEHVVVLQLDLRVELLTDAKNNGTRGTRGFRQV